MVFKRFFYNLEYFDYQKQAVFGQKGLYSTDCKDFSFLRFSKLVGY